jgi:hypothetical protein
MKRILSRGSVCLLVSLCALLVLSCSKKDDIPETVPVAGKVTVDGNPLAAGNVSYHAFDKEQKTGAMIAGQIDSTGGYVVYTGGKDGAPPGRYKVTVTPSMIPTGDSKMPSMPFHAKFTDVSKTPLVVTVAANAPPGTYDLKLTK